jgi:transcriptional regulator with XRE-family HTH domain
MSRQRVYVGDGAVTSGDPQAIQFAKRLKEAMMRKGWTQSELARRSEDYLPSGKSFGRHLASTYMRGLHMPNQVNLEAMSKALGVAIDDLVPEGSATIVGVTDRAINVTMSSSGMARLKLDMELPSDIALQIMTLANSARQGVQP